MKLLNLFGKKLNVAINENPPFTSMKFDNEKKIWTVIGGIEGQIVETLSDQFNFTPNYINCHGVWGAQQENGSWNGIVRMLIDQQADIGIGGVSVTYARSRVIKYTYPHMLDTVTFVTSMPKNDHHKNDSLWLLRPFEIEVWYFFLLSLFFLFLT